jgi:hypothetical protein
VFDEQYGVNFPSTGSVQRWPEQILVALLGHPDGALEMAVMDMFRPFGFFVRVQPENDLDRLLPVRAFLIRVEQPQVTRWRSS